jgi:hypothetical protein
MDLVALTQYFDTLQIVGADSRTKVIFLPSNPGAIGNYMNEIRSAFTSGIEAGDNLNIVCPVSPRISGKSA